MGATKEPKPTNTVFCLIVFVANVLLEIYCGWLCPCPCQCKGFDWQAEEFLPASNSNISVTCSGGNDPRIDSTAFVMFVSFVSCRCARLQMFIQLIFKCKQTVPRMRVGFMRFMPPLRFRRSLSIPM